MTLRLLFLAALALLTTASIAQSEDDADFSLYALGNSLTDELRYDDFVKMVESGGKTIRLARQTVPGAPIGWLWENNLEGGGFTTRPYGPPKNAFENWQWDAISLQPFQWNYDRNIVHAPNYARLIWETSPEATVYIYAQWPHNAGGDWIEKWRSPRTEEIMSREEYEDLTAYMRDNLSEEQVRLIPAGHVMYVLEQKARAGLVPGIESMWQAYDDGVHVNNLGNLIVTATYYATIFGEDPTGLDYSMFNGEQDKIAITPELARVVRESAWEVVATHPWTGVSSDAPVKVVTPAVDPAVVGSDYSWELLSAFGKAPHTWRRVNGSLPEGMELTPEGELRGAAAASGEYAFTAEVRGADGSTAQQLFTLKVVEDTGPKITSPAVITLEQGAFITGQLTAESTNPPLRWRVVEGSLPASLELSEAGLISGAPGKIGEFRFRVAVDDGDTTDPERDSREMTLQIVEPSAPISYARALVGEPTIDGSLEGDPWQFPETLGKTLAGQPDNAVRLDFGWHGQNLYIAVAVQDDNVIANGPPEQQDRVKIYLDGLNNREATYNWDDVELISSAGGRTEGRRFGIGGTVGKIDGGYLVEAKIGLRPLGHQFGRRNEPPIDWRSIGIDIVVEDTDAPGASKPESILAWHGSLTNSEDPSQFRTVIFTPAQE
ncbi:MAG: putative Ig domain-containing protein [Opitutales bacterium]